MVGGLVSGYLLFLCFLVLGCLCFLLWLGLGLGLGCFWLGFGEEGELGVCCVGEGE